MVSKGLNCESVPVILFGHPGSSDPGVIAGCLSLAGLVVQFRSYVSLSKILKPKLLLKSRQYLAALLPFIRMHE